MKKMKTWGCCAIMMIGSMSVSADVGPVKLVSCDGVKGFKGATWSETVADPGTRDYLVTDKTIYKPEYVAGGMEEIPSKSFTFGEVGGETGVFFAYYSARFGNEGVIFANGECYPNQTDPVIYGKVTVTSPVAAPFRFRGYGNNKRGIAFAEKVECAADCGILAYSHKTNGFHLTFMGDVSKFYGSVAVTSEYDSVGRPWGADLAFKDSASFFGGTVEIGADATLNVQTGTSIGTVILRKGADLDITAGKKLTVRNALVKEDDLPITVSLSGAPRIIGEISEVVRYDFITVPAGCDLTVDDFDVINLGSTMLTMPVVGMESDEETGSKTFYAIYHPHVEMLKDEESDNDLSATNPFGSSSVTNAGYWSDSKVVHGGGYIYRIVQIPNQGVTYFSLPYQAESPYVFPGYALYFAGNTSFFLRSPENVVSNVIFESFGGSMEIYGLRNSKNDLSLISGNFILDGTLDLSLRGETKLRLIGPIKGGGNSKIKLQAMSNATSDCRGWGELRGDNSKFEGKIHVTAKLDRVQNFEKFASLIVTSPLNLGGPRREFAHDALEIDRHGRLDVVEDVSLAEPTRGIYAHGIARIYVEGGKTLSVGQQLTVNGSLYKEGAGSLVLGGSPQFMDGEGNITENIPQDATNRTLYVTGGRVKAVSAHALDGLDVVFSNMTSKLDVGLVVDMNAADENLRGKGVCNVKSPAPFALPGDENTEKIPVYLECADGSSADEYAFGVMTVRKGCEGVFSRLRLVKPRSHAAYKLILSTDENSQDGTVTLNALMRRSGFTVIIR